MNLPFVKHLQEHLVEYRVPRMTARHWAINATLKDEGDRLIPDVVFRVEARMFFQQRISGEEWQRANSGDRSVMRMVRSRAVRAIAREAYGPIADELRQILILLWEEGLHDSEAAKRIDALIPILRGEKDN